jgi:hypothetical protein
LYSIDKKTLIAYPAGKTATSFIIPNSVKSIGDYAFVGSTSLVSVTIPDSVTSIGECSFVWCDSLTSVTIPDSVTSIEYCAFLYCWSLTSVTFQDTIPSNGISSYAFPFGDLREKFYLTNSNIGTPGTYTTSNPGWDAIWTLE